MKKSLGKDLGMVLPISFRIVIAILQLNLGMFQRERERCGRDFVKQRIFFFFSALGFLPSPELLSQPPCRPLPLAGSLPLKPRFHTPDKPGFLLVSCLAIFHRSLHTLGEVSLHRAPWHNAACRFQFIPRQTVDCISLAPLDHVFHENDGIL